MAGKFFSKILDYISFDDPELEEQEMDMIDEQDDEILAAERACAADGRESAPFL